jgi:hypothetical protein
MVTAATFACTSVSIVAIVVVVGHLTVTAVIGVWQFFALNVVMKCLGLVWPNRDKYFIAEYLRTRLWLCGRVCRWRRVQLVGKHLTYLCGEISLIGCVQMLLDFYDEWITEYPQLWHSFRQAGPYLVHSKAYSLMTDSAESSDNRVVTV